MLQNDDAVIGLWLRAFQITHLNETVARRWELNAEQHCKKHHIAYIWFRGKHTFYRYSEESTSKMKRECTWLYCDSMNSGVMLGIPAIALRLSDSCSALALPELFWAYVTVSDVFSNIQRIPVLFTWSLAVKVVCKRGAVPCHVIVAMECRRGTLGPFSCQIECPGKAARFPVCRTQGHSWTSAVPSISFINASRSQKSHAQTTSPPSKPKPKAS